jgi:TetR/AcrR family transcriptional regulator, cholesterol catabolism regulator
MRKDSSMGDTRTEILDAAQTAFSVNGYRGTSLDEVAQQLGITRQALYYYFPRKVDVLIELNRQMISLFSDNADQALAEMARDPTDDTFTTLMRSHLQTVAENVSLVTVLQESGNVPDPEAKELEALRRAYQNRFIVAYRTGVRQDRLRDVEPRIAVNVLLGAANHLAQWYYPQGEVPPEKIAGLTLELLREGFALKA